MVGTLGNLYRSVDAMNTNYFHSKQNKNNLLNPSFPLTAQFQLQNLLQILHSSSLKPPTTYYSCSKCHYRFTTTYDIKCPYCSGSMSATTTFVQGSSGGAATSPNGGGGYVKEMVTYMVMDDLSVKPMSSMSSLAMLKEFNMEDAAQIEEKLVNLDAKQGVKLLKASLHSSNVSLKLLVHKTSRKILFGQANKNFIDFLFTILALPVSSIFNLVSTETTVGPLRNLYHSVQNLDTNVFRAKSHNFLLKPYVQLPRSIISSLSQLVPLESSLPNGFYSCSSSDCHGYYTTTPFGRCPGCKSSTTKRMQLVPCSPSGEMLRELMTMTENIGYVKDKIPYMVMEDLTVKLMSAMTTISMLALSGVNDIGLVEEKVVYLEPKQCLDLIRVAIDSSSTVLSDVFLHNIEFEDSKSTEEEQIVVASKLKNFNLGL